MSSTMPSHRASGVSVPIRGTPMLIFSSSLPSFTITISTTNEQAEKMKCNAWGVAWRIVRPKGIFPEGLIEEDELKWRQYDNALSQQWRRNKIQYKSAMEWYFGKRTVVDKLFHVLDASFDELSLELWFIYHENPSNPNVFMQYYVIANGSS
jgi:hypothetical protein